MTTQYFKVYVIFSEKVAFYLYWKNWKLNLLRNTLALEFQITKGCVMPAFAYMRLWDAVGHFGKHSIFEWVGSTNTQ